MSSSFCHRTRLIYRDAQFSISTHTHTALCSQSSRISRCRPSKSRFKFVVLVYIYFPIQLKFQFSRSACSLFEMDHPCPAKRKYDYATSSLQRVWIAMTMAMETAPPTLPIKSTKRMMAPPSMPICDRTM